VGQARLDGWVLKGELEQWLDGKLERWLKRWLNG